MGLYPHLVFLLYSLEMIIPIESQNQYGRPVKVFAPPGQNLKPPVATPEKTPFFQPQNGYGNPRFGNKAGAGNEESNKKTNFWERAPAKTEGYKTPTAKPSDDNKYKKPLNVYIPPGQNFKPPGATPIEKEPVFQPKHQYINPAGPNDTKPTTEKKRDKVEHQSTIEKPPPTTPTTTVAPPQVQERYFQLDFYVFTKKTTIKSFKYTAAKEILIELGIKKGKKYRWLVADCMANAQSMFELAEAFKTAFPEDNVMIVTWDNVVTKDPVFGAGYAEFRRALEHVSNVIVWAIYKIHMVLYDFGSPSILDNLHIIGFGHGGLIAGHAAWLLNHKKEQIKESGSVLNFDNVRPVLVDRLTVINTANFCNNVAEDEVKECQDAERAYPHYKKDLANKNCAKFVDGVYTHRLGLSSTICPRFNGSAGLLYHRGVHINEEVGPVSCNQKLEVPTGQMCTGLLTHCNHQVGLQYYISAIKLLYGSKTGCHEVLEMMFGEKDINVPGESVAADFYFETKDENPFGSQLGCEEQPEAELPDLKSLSVENCERNELEITKATAWQWNRY